MNAPCNFKVPIMPPKIEVTCDMSRSEFTCYRRNCSQLCNQMAQSFAQGRAFDGCVPTTAPTYVVFSRRPSAKPTRMMVAPTTSSPFVLPVPTPNPSIVLPPPRFVVPPSSIKTTMAQTTTQNSGTNLVVIFIACGAVLVVGAMLIGGWLYCKKKHRQPDAHVYQELVET